MRKLPALSFLAFAAACGVEPPDRPLTVSSPPLATREDTPAAIALDTDGTVTSATARHGRIEAMIYTPDADYHGDDVATVTVTDGEHTATAHVAITVTPVDDAPVARRDAFAARQDVPVRIVAAALTANDADADGDALTVVDVKAGRDGAVARDGDFIVLTLPDGWNGIAHFTYTVSDGAQTAPGVVTVIVGATDQPPIAGADRVATDEDVHVNVSAASLLANDFDPNGAELSITSVGGAEGGTVALAGDAVVFTPAGDYHGHGSFHYTVSDGSKTGVGQVDVQIAPVADAPVAKPDALSTDEDVALVIATADLLANDVDADGDPLVVTKVSGAFGGRATLDGGLVVFTPDADYHGEAGFTYTISDGTELATAAVSMSVGAGNDAPIARDDGAVTTEDTAIEIAILDLIANDTEPDGDAIAVTAVTDAIGGTAVLEPNQVVKFTPDPDRVGTVGFRYVLSDGSLSASAWVGIDVTPVNDAPVAHDDAFVTTEDVAVVMSFADLVGNDDDADGDELFATEILEVHGGTAQLGGGAIVFMPDPNWSGTAQVVYRVTDGVEVSVAAIEIGVVPANDPPGVSAATTVTDEDTAVDIALSAADVDGDVLTFAIVVPPAHGTLTGDGPVLSYLPDLNYHGHDAFTVEAFDGHGSSATAVVSLWVLSVVECGDGELDAPASPGSSGGTEECDDGNTLPGDGCDATCHLESVVEVPPLD